MLNISRRQGNWLGFVICAGMMAYALYAQHVLFLEPCNLCIFQRIAVITMGVWFLVAALHGGASAKVRRVYGALIGLSAAFGVAVASRHLYIQSLPVDESAACGPGLNYLLDTFPLGETLKLVFFGSGRCADIDWSLFGLSMPAWVLISILPVGLAGLWLNWREAD
ncbi:MAG: disulfide bond formation protein B [Gammaproteobacteria bacterium]